MTFNPEVTDLLAELIKELDDENTLGFSLGGSYAREEATQYSDIDFTRFVKTPVPGYQRHYYLHRHNLIIEVANIPIEPAWQDLTRPQQAIWLVPALRQLKVLQDKDGSVGKLLQAAREFEWEPLQNAANEYASYLLHERVETVLKIIGKLNKSDRSELELRRPVSLLVELLMHLMAVQLGVLIKTGDTYFSQVQEAAGKDSTWTQQLLLASGISSNPSKIDWFERAEASLRLYLETAALLQPIIRAQDREVINFTVTLIQNELKLSQ